jgi:hypothetical protein
MITIIICIFIVILLLITFKYFSGRNKSRHEKSGLEKAANTIVNKAKRSVNDFAEGLRDLDTVKKELLDALDSCRVKLKNDYAEYLRNLIKARDTYAKVIASSETRITAAKNKAKEYKTKFEKSQKEVHKNMANKFISNVLAFQKTLDNAIKQRDVVVERLEESKGIYDLELMKLENKRLDIINMTSAPNSSIVLSDFNIEDLTSEFREKIEIKNIDAEVSTRMSTEVESEESTISNEEINSYYDLL